MKRHWVPLISGTVAFLTVAGGGTAWALWTASADHAGGEASAATVGITQAVHEGLDGSQYSWDPAAQTGVRATAGKVTITNTGSREATARLTATLLSTEYDVDDPDYKPALGEDLHVGYTLLADEDDACAPGNMAGGAQPSLNLGPGHGYSAGSQLDLPGNTPPVVAVAPVIAAGDSATICVELWIEASKIPNYGPAEFVVGLSGQLRYADGAAWTIVSDDEVTQTIAAPADEQFFENPAARYNITHLLANGSTWVCLWRNSGNAIYVRNASDNACLTAGGWANDPQYSYRLVRIPDTHQYYIQWAQNVNQNQQPTEQRFTHNAANDYIVTATAANTGDDNLRQRWQLRKITATGNFQLKNAYSGLCASQGSGNLPDANDPTHVGLLMVTCSDSDPTQQFNFQLIGNHNPYPFVQLGCNNTAWRNPGWEGFDLTWPANTGYEAEVAYRAYIGGTIVEPAPNSPLPRTRNGGSPIMTSGFNGYSPVIQFYGWNTNQLAWSTFTALGAGTYTLTVEQQLPFSEWYVVAYRSIEKDASGNFRCV